MQQDSQQAQEWASAQRFLPAVILIAVGAIFLLNNLHLFPARDIWEYWPVALMVAGAFKLADATLPAGRAIGGILLIGGGVVLASNLGLIPVNPDDLWPLAIIAAGVFMLVNRTSNPWRFRASIRTNMAQEAAIFGGGKRKINSQDFKYAKFDAVFGGFELDFRNANIVGDSATVEINAVFGGAEVRIPTNWSAVVEGVGVFAGSFNDDTVQPSLATAPNFKRLYFKGAAVFGGVNIKN
jgi:cell wall-active antibiotic response 4TMS protein YvqF